MTGKERRKDGSGMVTLLTAEVNFSVLQCVGELPCLGDHICADPWHCIFGANLANLVLEPIRWFTPSLEGKQEGLPKIVEGKVKS